MFPGPWSHYHSSHYHSSFLNVPHFSDDHQFHGGADPGRGITVTSNSGVQYFQQPGGHQLGLSHLPAFPGPTSQASQYLGQVAQPQTPGPAFTGQGYPGYSQPVAAVAPQQRLPPREERVDLNPGGRHKTERLPGGAGRGGIMGSMESLTSSQGSEISFGSTMSSNGNTQCNTQCNVIYLNCLCWFFRIFISSNYLQPAGLHSEGVVVCWSLWKYISPSL